MYELILYPNDFLSTPCVEVTDFDESLAQLLDQMKEVMLEHRGIGLSSNQVGASLRIFIMQQQSNGEILEFINPMILEESTDEVVDNEGCLSTPGVFVPIRRPRQVTIEAYNRNGEAFTGVLYDIEARCALHEINHLDGVDYLSLTNRQNRRAALSQLGVK